MPNSTIYALSTPYGKAGVGVVRLSGERSLECLHILSRTDNFEPKKLTKTNLYHPEKKELMDSGMAVFFKSPYSFTGEDIVELHIHSSRAVINSIYEALSSLEGVRIANPGEFSRRAVLNNKMDLTEAEGILDLINSETDAQRVYALRQQGGILKNLYDKWRNILLKKLAWMEAYIDFPEEDIPGGIRESSIEELACLADEISAHINNSKGRRLREGFNIAIVGEPNSGKSSLLNALVKKEAAIVSSIPGTTRDIVEVYMDMDGYPVIFADTAGLRETSEEVESEGIRRALERAELSDLIILVLDATKEQDILKSMEKFKEKNVLVLINKTDLAEKDFPGALHLSVKKGEGIDAVWKYIKDTVKEAMSVGEDPVLTRERHKESLVECADALHRCINTHKVDMVTEDIRLAIRALGKITGQVQVNEVLDIVFNDFCIGK